MPGSPSLGPAHEYFLDAWQRSVLFLDVLRQRGNIYREQQAKAAPNVLEFDAELVLDGRTLPRPVNYLLVRIRPPKGVEIDPAKRPFVVVDPRAGHGPGIGGMKRDSEIGVALENGHPCYFIGFLPEPMPDQTIEDVWTAEAEFIREVSRRHPGSDKPAVIGNCQAGWQTMIMAATNPDVPGPLLLAGAPLSYWAGVHGKNPMRYTGGLLGGTWMTAMTGDLGGGKFDGANLVANFESLDPANTYFEKPYNVYANIDTEVQRFLEFETWWGSPVLLNAGEMQWIADNLFVGNKLTNGKIRTSGGVQVDLRNIKSPIIVFCSRGDNITPPQQALGWITDIYDSDDDLVANGQTIVYSLHETKRLSDLVGPSKAKEMLMGAKVIQAEEALQCGLATRLFRPEDLERETFAFADELARLSQTTIRGVKKMVGLITHGEVDDTPETRALSAGAFESPDYREGRDAFLEKRKPNFTVR